MTLRGPETWTPERRGRALFMIYALANAPLPEWRSKKELHAALAEFRDDNGEIAQERKDGN